MPEPLKPVLDLMLDGSQFRLAKNGGYSLHIPLAPDPFGVVAHVPVGKLTNEQTNAIVQLLGTYIERCHSLEAAVQKGAP